ncbi:MAG: pyridoxal-phosphate dependent enzyme [Acidimicrobiia bacterium]|nr:pyridoxal-phosphate dependent enzyme [Acidimicrobiia bacterium]
MSGSSQVTSSDVTAAAGRIAPHVIRTPVLRHDVLDDWAGCRVVAKAEHLQGAGAFKLRGATNAVLLLDEVTAARGVAAHSSGNHGAALALAGSRRGVPVTVVMPADAPEVKKRAVAGYGATIMECAPWLAARESTLAEVVATTGATEIHPYDNPDVIAGAGTAALELVDQAPDLDVVMAPVGGGGLISGTSLASHGIDHRIRVIGAEPERADDAARSLAAGTLIPQTAPDTMADGLRTALSARTFSIISAHVERIITISEDEIVAALRLCWDELGWRIEPSAAVAIAALRHPGVGGDVGVILTGGNVPRDGRW